MNLFDSCNNKDALPNEVNALFKLMEENQIELSHVKLEHEKETADLDLFWFSYTGYHWNNSLQHVIGCTHDKRAVNEILPWRDLIIQLLNKFYSVRYKGGIIKLFESKIKFIKDYVVAEVQSS